jgi:hypothetical protein
MKRRAIGIAMTFVLLAACGGQPPTLTPAPGTQPAPDDREGATAEAAGVRLTAWAQRWTGEPQTLETEVTPLLIRLENNSQQQLAVRFGQFNLQNREGGDFSAIPPFNIDETVTEPLEVSGFTMSGFWVAPYLGGYYRGLRGFRDPFLLDRLYYERLRPLWQTVNLPTGDMVRLALPEGVIDPGGVAMGFVYFEDVSDDPAEVTLDFELITPSGENFGRVQIPFRVES